MPQKKTPNSLSLKNFSDFQNHKKLVLAAIKGNVNAFKFARESLRKDRDFIKQAIQANSQIFYHIEPSLRSDRELLFFWAIVHEENQEALFQKFTSYEQDVYIKELDKKILNPIKEKIAYYQNINTDESERLKNAFENLLYQCNFVITRCYHVCACSEADAAVVNLSANSKNTINQELTQTLKNKVNRSNLDKSLIPVRDLCQHLLVELQAINDRETEQNDELNSTSESEQLVLDRQQALQAIRDDGLALKDFPAFQADKEIVLAAIKQNNEAFSYADESLRNDRDFVKQALFANPQVFNYLALSLQSDRELLFCTEIAGKNKQQELLEKFAEYEQDLYIKELNEKIFQKIKDQISHYQALNTPEAKSIMRGFLSLLVSCNAEIVGSYIHKQPLSGDDTAMAQLSKDCKNSIKQQLTVKLNHQVKANQFLDQSLTPVRDLCKKLLGVLLLIPTGGLPLLSMNYRTYFFATADKYQVYRLAQQVAHIDTQADTNSINAEHGSETETSKLSLT